MTKARQTLASICDVVVVGGGPAGLAAATRLRELGIKTIVVLEREPSAGGIPRHCGHPPFGMREFHRILSGPQYATALVKRSLEAGVKIFTNTTVTQIHEGGRLSLITPDGTQEIVGKRVLLCTGVRETPRAPRFISGQRPLGISTTGALQSMVYLKDTIPFRRPVIIGTELVSFSSLLTCRKAGIKPVAMIESKNQITARSFCRFLPIIMGVPLRLETQLVEIIGNKRVKGVRIKSSDGRTEEMNCDGVLFTGQFTPESSLMRMGHLDVDRSTGGPAIDQYGQCSDPCYFATGNLLHPVETAGWCWQEGKDTAYFIAQSLTRKASSTSFLLSVKIQSPKIKYALPQHINLSTNEGPAKYIQVRFIEEARGQLTLEQSGKILWTKNYTFLPERRILIPIPENITKSVNLQVCFLEET